MKTTMILLALMCAGCDSSDKNAAGIQAIVDGCAKPVSVEIRLNAWGNEVVVKCDEAKPRIKK